MEKIAHRALLFDFYGPLLTGKQQEIYDLYFQQDLSLGEIAELFSVSRQAIYDLLKRTENSLAEYETKLGLLKKHQANQELGGRILQKLEEIEEKYQLTELEEMKLQIKTILLEQSETGGE